VKRSWGKAKFLNKPGFHSVAAISYKIELEKVLRSDDHESPFGSVTISNCNRSIELDISAENDQAYENSLYKLDTLIEVLQAARKDHKRAWKKANRERNKAK